MLSNHHLLPPPSPFAFNLYQHQGLLQWVSALYQVAKVFGASASASILPMNIQGWFPLGLTGLILLSKGLSRVFSNTTIQKHQFSGTQPSLESNFHMTIGKTIALTIWTFFVGKLMSLLFNTLFRFVKAFLPRNKCFLISWLQSLSAVILEPKKIKSVIDSTFPPSICHEVMGLMPWFSCFECWVLSQLFHSPLSPSSRGSLVPFCFLPLEWYHLHIWGCWYLSR